MAIGFIHQHLVFPRRAQVLARELSAALPAQSMSLLDVGCGDGAIDTLIAQRRAGLSITGVDVLVRPQTQIPVQQFDGTQLPFADQSFDAVMLVDVLHHTADPMVLLREARRVAKLAVVLKDHTRESAFADIVLRFMDWVGNARHGVAAPHNYWPHAQWMRVFQQLGLRVYRWNTELGLYPRPASWLFERNLHFVAGLAVA